MKFTQEQEQIFRANDDIMIIEAVAGSGKTTTLFEYMKRYPNKKFLYLVFNKKMKEDAEKKRKTLRLSNVEVSTIHSFCLRNRIAPLATKEIKNINIYEIAQKLNIKIDIVREYINIFNLFLNSKYNTDELDEFINSYKKELLMIINNISSKEIRDEIPKNIKNGIIKFLLELFNGMFTGTIERSFDYLLKDFQLNAKSVNKYDIVLIDEAQDVSPVMLEIVKTKFPNSKKIFVGDSLQQIYSWRGAINSLQNIEGVRYSLTNSFRVGKNIEETVKAFYKKIDIDIKLVGVNNKNIIVSKVNQRGNFTFLARANSSLVFFALKNLHKKIYLPENIKFDVLMDVYKFWAFKNKNKNPALLYYKNFKELKEDNENELIFDNELSLSIMLVDKYGTKIPDLINNLKNVAVKDIKEADLILMTAHSTKGLEFEKVIVANDFISNEKIEEKKKNLEETIKRTRNHKKKKKLKKIFEEMLDRIQEEFNIKYVAYTRSYGEIELEYPIIIGKK